VKSIRADYAAYLQSHLYGEYVSENDERPGLWLGFGAEALGLRGHVTPVAQQNLMNGMSPDGTKPLNNVCRTLSDLPLDEEGAP
jgi:hypothetical protein